MPTEITVTALTLWRAVGGESPRPLRAARPVPTIADPGELVELTKPVYGKDA